MKLSIIIILFLSSFDAYSTYLGKIDYSELQTKNILKVTNKSVHNIRCRMFALNDVIYLELKSEQESIDVKTIKGLRYHEIGIQCEIIKKITKNNLWRKNKYKNNSSRIKKVFFP